MERSFAEKAIYTLLLIAEGFIGFFSVLMLCSWQLWGICIAVLAVFAALMVFWVIRLKKHTAAGNHAAAGKTRIWIALTMLVPILPTFVVVIGLVIGLAIYG